MPEWGTSGSVGAPGGNSWGDPARPPDRASPPCYGPPNSTAQYRCPWPLDQAATPTSVKAGFKMLARCGGEFIHPCHGLALPSPYMATWASGGPWLPSMFSPHELPV